MGRSRIKGITIEIGGDTTKLERALADVNKQIKTTQSGLKDVDKLLKFDPGNTELLKQKQQYLADAIAATTEKIAKEKEALEQLNKANGGEGLTEEQKALARDIAETEQSLKRLTQQSKEFGSVFKQQMKAAADDVAKTSKKIADATKGMSALAAGGLTGLFGMAVSSGKNADDLNTLAKQTGIATDELQKFAYASDLIDVSMDDMTGALKRMKNTLRTSEDAFAEMGVAVRDSNGEYRDATDIFYAVVAALGQIDNETERDVKAMALFGRSADSLAGILDDGGASLRALSQEAEDKGLIISQEDLDKANELNDTIDELKATLSGDFGKAAVSVMQALAPAITVVAEKISEIASKLTELDPSVVQITAVVLALIAAISPVAGIISSIATVTGVLAAVEWATVGPILAVVAAIAALIAIGVALYKNWDEIKAKTIELKDNLVAKFSELKNNIVEKITAIKDGFLQKFAEMKEAAINKVQEIKSGITERFWELIDSAKSWGHDLIANLVSGITEKIDMVKDAAKSVADKISSFLHFSEPDVGPLSNFHTFMPDMMDMLATGIEDNLDILSRPMTDLAAALVPNTNGTDLSRIEGMLSQYMPNLGNQSVNVVLEGDAKGLFKAVRSQNRIFKASTGTSAF